MSSSVHANNRTKNFLVLGKDFMQGLDNTTIYAEKLYSINFNKTNTKFCDICHCCHLYNRCHYLNKKAMNFNDVAIASIKGNDYRIHFWYMSNDDAISRMNNSSLNEKDGSL